MYTHNCQPIKEAGEISLLFCKKADAPEGLLTFNPHTSEDCIPLLVDMEESSSKNSYCIL